MPHWRNLTLPQVLDHITDGFALLDDQWRIVYMNAEAHRFAGSPPGSLIGKSLPDDWPQVWQGEIGQQYQTAAREQRSVHFECSVQLPDHVQWLDIHAHPLPEGGLAVYYRDITDRKTAEQEKKQLENALARKAEEFELLFKNAPVGIAVSHDPECREIRINPEFERMIAIPKSGNVSKSDPEASQLPFRFFQKGREVPADELPQQVCQRTGQPVKEVELELLSADGHRFHIFGSAVPLFDADGKVRGSIAAWTDITARREQEEAARKLIQRLRFHVENTPLAVVEFDPDFRILHWSPRAEEMFGWSAREVLGKTVTDLRWVHEEDLSRVADLWQGMLSGAEDISLNSNRNYRKDGQVVFCDWYNSALRDQNGSLISVFSLVLDVTERVRQEAALRQSKEDWERFSSILAHDLREPLRNISIFSEKLEADYAEILNDDGRRFLQHVHRGSETMSDLLRGLLQFIRTSQAGNLRLKPTPARRAAQSALHNLYTTIQEASAQVTIEPLPDVLADESQLTLVFQNLIANAVRYRRPGVIPVISIRATQQADKATISVTDNGLGFEMEYAARIFEPFERLHSKAVSGSGLGLTIVKRIIDRFGGTTWAQSIPNQGSTFSFTLTSTTKSATETA